MAPESEIDVLARERQRRRDGTFLVMLGLLLAVSGLAVVRSAYPPRKPGAVSPGGEIRPVESGTLRRGLRSGRLSDQPAKHWRPADGPRRGAP